MKRTLFFLALGLSMSKSVAATQKSPTDFIDNMPSVSYTLPTHLPPPDVKFESEKTKLMAMKNLIKKEKADILNLRAKMDHKGSPKPTPFMRTAEKSEDLWKNLSFINSQISDLKSRFFNKKLQAFDFKVQMFHKGNMSMASYIELLTQMKDKSLGPKTTNPQIDLFKKVHQLESKIDFQAVEKERSQVVRRLVYRLDSRHQQDLRKMILAYRLGDISHKDFYSYLQSACDKTGIKFNTYSNLSAYLHCVLLSDQLERNKFFTELKDLESQRYAGLIIKPAERTLIQQSTTLNAIAKLVDMSVASEEWARQKNSPL